MQLVVGYDKKEVIKEAVSIISDLIKRKPNAVLGLATGSTMIPLYKKLVKLYKKNKIDFSQVSTFNLDEYAGIEPDNKESYHHYMNKYLFNKVNIKKHNIHFPTDNEKEFEGEIEKFGGIDLCILGIGHDGHIAFNEPGSSFKSKTRKVNLSIDTIKANSRFFSNINKVPREAYTMGIETIMKSKRIVLLAFGNKKSEIIFKTLKGPISTKIPATILRRHKNAVFIIDRRVAKRL